MDGGAWQATVHGVPKSQTRLKQFNTHTYTSLLVLISLWEFISMCLKLDLSFLSNMLM